MDITWFDGELSTTRQRTAVENMASQDWDFVAIQALTEGTLADPVNKMIAKGIPVIAIDTFIAPYDKVNVHTRLTPDNNFMGTSVTQSLVDALNGEGKIIMTTGPLGFSAVQGRSKAFENVVRRFPKMEVLDTAPGDWDVTKVGKLWESWLNKYPKIDAAFFHNDDMALAAYNVMKAHNRTDILIGGVDAMPPAVDAVLDGRMYATVRGFVSPDAWRRGRRRCRGGSRRRKDGTAGDSADDRHRRSARNERERGGSPLGGGPLPHLKQASTCPALSCVTKARQFSRCAGSPNRLAAFSLFKGVDFTLNRGEIHGLVGENGAGKSTLMKIIAGAQIDFQGAMLIDGAPMRFGSTHDALRAGVGMVHQELSIAPDLTVAENMFLGRQLTNRLGIVDWRRMARETAAPLNSLGIEVDPRARAGALPLGLQQLVELGRVLFSGARIIILDEPTSALSPPEVQLLFRVLDDPQGKGREPNLHFPFSR